MMFRNLKSDSEFFMRVLELSHACFIYMLRVFWVGTWLTVHRPLDMLPKLLGHRLGGGGGTLEPKPPHKEQAPETQTKQEPSAQKKRNCAFVFWTDILPTSRDHIKKTQKGTKSHPMPHTPAKGLQISESPRNGVPKYNKKHRCDPRVLQSEPPGHQKQSCT